MTDSYQKKGNLSSPLFLRQDDRSWHWRVCVHVCVCVCVPVITLVLHEENTTEPVVLPVTTQ